MKKRDSFNSIIRMLAEEAPLTPNGISEEGNLPRSVVHNIIKNPVDGLERQKMVKVHAAEKWKTGRIRKEYVLSLRGLIEYFSLLVIEQRLDCQRIKQVVNKYSEFLGYPLLEQYRSLEKWLGNSVYDTFVFAAWSLKHYPQYIPLDFRLNLQETKAISKKISLEKFQGKFHERQRKSEAMLRLAYTYSFMNLALKADIKEKNRVTNFKLQEHFNQTYTRIGEELENKLKDLKKAQKSLEIQFIRLKKRGNMD
jgi:DNA-binding Lrp family transcriptional regulator